MNELTEFQISCEGQLSKALGTISRRLSNRELGVMDSCTRPDTDETYIHGEIEGSDIELWIYEDGAMFSGPEIDMRYEIQDYDNPEELMNTFIEELIATKNL